ncbi:type III-B CRISPR module RAMP protein Cmr6 [Pelomicrobium methylotrophicum]|uniref:Type III-B CRISPR module RAMP protein Cmr6 n=1 Tax=Pelomicrobium methylotrophicum TaxID=2602750 RepID=A0A5C7EJF7_9PROT|nr:type III-B CRISPR module RAMP protein Cmr6 [Pelomicrobium methylotrophicum]TXF11475.1 type III-B CRISPR module RAMP protein Cmr6 [Pelomicrobium methylotrophicum]
MPIAAVPAYLGQHFEEASPGMRFGMYLPIWTDRSDQEREVREASRKKSPEANQLRDILGRNGMDAAIVHMKGRRNFAGLWEKNTHAAKKAWGEVAQLNAGDFERGKALVQRQQAIAAACPGIFSLNALATAPFTTGLGNEHPLENGFAFLWPYGLPYLPGSGVKGVVRRAAEELASGQWEEDRGWRGLDRPAYVLEVHSGKEKRRIELSVLDVLFGREPPEGDPDAVRGALSFWDVIPRIEGDSLLVEVMTPHQSHYYQQKKEGKSGDSDTPHDSGQPTPIFFLTVPPGSQFTFYVVCDTAHLNRLTENKLDGAPDLLAEEEGKRRWQQLLKAAFEHAFEWLGFGAKTAVGYGAMTRPTETQEAKVRTESTRTVQTVQEIWEKATLEYKPNTGELVASFQGHRTAPLRGGQAQACLRQLGEELSARLKKKKPLTVTAEVRRQGNLIELVGVKPCA